MDQRWQFVELDRIEKIAGFPPFLFSQLSIFLAIFIFGLDGKGLAVTDADNHASIFFWNANGHRENLFRTVLTLYLFAELLLPFEKFASRSRIKTPSGAKNHRFARMSPEDESSRFDAVFAFEITINGETHSRVLQFV